MDPIANIAGILRRNYETALKAVEDLDIALPEGECTDLKAAVSRCIEGRRARGKFLPKHLFSDPAWDMLLALYKAELEQVRVATTNLGDVTEVPATTALRWINTLINENLAERQTDPLDSRRVFIRLSAEGLAGMEAYFRLTGLKPIS